MTNRTARNRPRADRAERKRVARNRAERTRVVRDWAERTRVARNRAERTRVVRDRAERTRSRYASVRAFVERLNAQPYELFKPRHRPPLSPRQFSLSTRVYRCLIGSISRHAFNLCLANAFLPVHATLCLLNCCQAAFASSKVVVVSPLLPVIRCQPPLPFSRCQPSVVLHPLSGSGVERALCPLFRILDGRMDAKRK